MPTPDWPIFPITTAHDWRSLNFMLPFWQAVDERYKAVIGTALSKSNYPHVDETLAGAAKYAYDADGATPPPADGDRWAVLPYPPAAVALDGEAATPPPSPSNGDNYAVLASATGDWAGHDGAIATWNAGASVWEFTTPSYYAEYQLSGGAYRISRPDGADAPAWLDGTGRIWVGQYGKIAEWDATAGTWSFESPAQYYTVAAGNQVLIKSYDPASPGAGVSWGKFSAQYPAMYHRASGSGIQNILEYLSQRFVNTYDYDDDDFQGLNYEYVNQYAYSYGEFHQFVFQINRWRELAGLRAADEQAFGGIRNSPPPTYSFPDDDEGLRWIVGNDASGDWAGHSGEIATWQPSTSTWTFETPSEGDTIQAGYQCNFGAFGSAYISTSGVWEDYPVGFTRKFPRRITSLSADGEIGDLARYVSDYPSFYYDEALLGKAAAPPEAPSVGDKWAVGAGATGDWAGHSGEIATWQTYPTQEWTFADADEDKKYRVTYGDQYLYYVSDEDEWEPVAASIYEHDGADWLPCRTVAAEPDTITSYGLAQPGDYIGVWIFNELKACIDLLDWTVTHEAATGDRSRYYGIGWNGATWAAAKAAAEADWQTNSYEPSMPEMRSEGTMNGGLYNSTIYSAECAVVFELADHVPCVIDVYAAATELDDYSGYYNVTFDANDLGFLEDKWAEYASRSLSAGAGAGHEEEFIIGEAADKPDWCVAPDSSPQRAGWLLETTRCHAVIKWDFDY